MRSLTLFLAVGIAITCYGAKADTTVKNLKARVAELENRIGQAKGDSIEMARLRERYTALEAKLDYLSEGNDRAINVAWWALGLIATLTALIAVVNFITNRNAVRAMVTTQINDLAGGVDQRASERMRLMIAEFKDDMTHRLRLLRIDLSNIDVAFRQSQAPQPLDLLGASEFDQQLEWIRAQLRKEQALPEVDGIVKDSFEGMVLYLKDHELSLMQIDDLESVLGQFGAKHAIHVKAVREKIRKSQAEII